MPISPVIFHNDFENSVSPFGWSSVQYDKTSAPTTDTLRPHHGARNFLVSNPAGAEAAAACYGMASYGSMAGAYSRLFGRVMNVIVDNIPEANADRFGFMAYNQSDIGLSLCSCGMINNGGAIQWFLRPRSGGAFANYIAGSLAANELHCVEMELFRNAGAGEARLFVDGVTLIEVTALNNTDRALNYFSVGHCFSDQRADVAVAYRCDCATLSTRRIGCEKFRMNLFGRGGGQRQKSNLFSTVREGTRMGLH